MKKQLALMVLTLAVALPSHAINSHYRQQLERSGCTQLTDGNGCDIHKTKAQNAAAQNPEKGRIADFLDSKVLDQKTDKAYAALTAKGWNNTKPLTWVKGRYTVFLDVGSDDKIDSVVLR
ncbi:hypothetical protein B9R80_002423 [Salmonella enterica]|nr:hypothetical protein [Salmonella enterica]